MSERIGNLDRYKSPVLINESKNRSSGHYMRVLLYESVEAITKSDRTEEEQKRIDNEGKAGERNA